MTNTPRHGDILSYAKVFFLAHAGHIQAYLHGIPHFSFPPVKYSSKAMIDFEKYLFASPFNGMVNQTGF